MSSNAATEISAKFTEGAKEHNLQPALDELNQDKSKMSPQQYSSLLKDLNKDLAKTLPGVTFTDANATGSVALLAKDDYGMSLSLTGDAAGATNLAKVAADAKMPNAENFVASKMDGATLKDQQTDQAFYKTKDGGTAIVNNVDSETRYHFSGPNGEDIASLSSDPKDPHPSYVYLGSRGYESHPATSTTPQYDVLFKKNMDNPTSMLVENPQTGEVTSQKVSHIKKDLEVAGIAAGIIGIQGAAEASQVKLDQSKAPVVDKLAGTVMVDDAGADLIVGLANKAPGAIKKPVPPSIDAPPQSGSN